MGPKVLLIVCALSISVKEKNEKEGGENVFASIYTLRLQRGFHKPLPAIIMKVSNFPLATPAS